MPTKYAYIHTKPETMMMRDSTRKLSVMYINDGSVHISRGGGGYVYVAVSDIDWLRQVLEDVKNVDSIEEKSNN